MGTGKTSDKLIAVLYRLFEVSEFIYWFLRITTKADLFLGSINKRNKMLIHTDANLVPF